MKRLSLLIFLLAPMLAACASPAATIAAATAATAPRTLTVYAAASLSDAFKEIGKNFKVVHPGIIVRFSFASSSTLRAQLEQGAVADVFASANHAEMDMAVKAGLIAQDAPQDFLTNTLIVILPADNPANVQALQDLSRRGLKLVLGDVTVPAGKYARQVLDNLSEDPALGSDLSIRVLENVVSNETDVKQVVAKIQLGEADAGIVYASDAIAAPQLMTLEIPAKYNVTATYPIATLTEAPNLDLASAFVAYVLSSDGQAILKKWGFTPLGP